MAEQQNGLRFDIYERVHLSEGVAGIKHLEDVELVPHIQVVPQGDQALLRGNLLLSGTYVDEQDAVNRTLEHLIPVEITLPLNRVHRVEDIAVEIENFDVDILSARSLNITGVLSLNGLEEVIVAPSADEIWHNNSDEVLFVHEAPTPARPDTSVPFLTEDNYAQSIQERSPSSAYNDPPNDTNELTADAEDEAEEWLDDESDEALDVFQHQQADIYEASYAAEDKKEPRVAFTGKPSDSPEPVKPFGLTSLLQSSSSVKAEQRLAESEAASNAPSPGDRLEWKKLLLSSTSEKQEFRRVRLCIVQKEETLEIIAKRYELNPREIALFNRLAEHEVSVGQIVYIPK
ncbi:stage VI sporulation protein D [Paenibacillus sp. 1_12]|uniref:LysM peptidoglycan-binding domain-containing protein n=1 Tax=Paenibacillus sp. 1_12 TaxID=1566278 RepID=UPI0008E90C7B|nr:LysM peptidoglycan-binding domain-containing protein [Paenibacillus sp. 1_12]SFK70148.1 stage VI sporulation protein D [Paenibacillus sp. 1_12]